MSKELEDVLRKAFDTVLVDNFGGSIPPEPYITSTGIVPLDALLGGGIGSSLPVMLSSAPETGKSSIAVYLAKKFLSENENSFVAYIDSETASAGTDGSSGIAQRIKNLNIPKDRFQYNPVLITVDGIYTFVAKYAELKKKLEEKTNEEVKLLIIVDSLASCPCSKALTAEDTSQYIGLKSRELSHNLEKIKQIMAFSKVNLILIDQVRANMQISSGPRTKQDEKGVGVWNNIKSSSGSSALQH